MTAPPLTAFITTADLGNYLRRNLSDDPAGAFAVEAACDLIRKAANQDINGVVGDIITIDGTGTDTILLPQLPVVAVTAVKLTSINGDAPTDVPVHSYVIDLREGSLHMIGTTWRRRRGAYEITYTHGYNTEGSGTATCPAIPPLLKALACTIAARIYDQGIAAQETVGGYQTIFGTPTSLSLAPTEINLVARFAPGRK